MAIVSLEDRAAYRADSSGRPILSEVVAPSSWSGIAKTAQTLSRSIVVPQSVVPVGLQASDAFGITDAIGNRQPVAAAVQSIPQGFVQAAGGPVANNPLASLVGVGLAGSQVGTGPLPGGLGLAARNIFGMHRVPRIPKVHVILDANPDFLRALEKTGASIVTRLLGIDPSVLQNFRMAFWDLSNLNGEGVFRAGLMTLLRELIEHVTSGLSAPSTVVPVNQTPQTVTPFNQTPQMVVPIGERLPPGVTSWATPVGQQTGRTDGHTVVQFPDGSLHGTGLRTIPQAAIPVASPSSVLSSNASGIFRALSGISATPQTPSSSPASGIFRALGGSPTTPQPVAVTPVR